MEIFKAGAGGTIGIFFKVGQRSRRSVACFSFLLYSARSYTCAHYRRKSGKPTAVKLRPSSQAALPGMDDQGGGCTSGRVFLRPHKALRPPVSQRRVCSSARQRHHRHQRHIRHDQQSGKKGERKEGHLRFFLCVLLLFPFSYIFLKPSSALSPLCPLPQAQKLIKESGEKVTLRVSGKESGAAEQRSAARGTCYFLAAKHPSFPPSSASHLIPPPLLIYTAAERRATGAVRTPVITASKSPEWNFKGNFVLNPSHTRLYVRVYDCKLRSVFTLFSASMVNSQPGGS